MIKGKLPLPKTLLPDVGVDQHVNPKVLVCNVRNRSGCLSDEPAGIYDWDQPSAKSHWRSLQWRTSSGA